MARPTQATATVEVVVEDATAVYETLADELYAELANIRHTHARETRRRQREIRRLELQRARFLTLADQARAARALLPAGLAS